VESGPPRPAGNIGRLDFAGTLGSVRFFTWCGHRTIGRFTPSLAGHTRCTGHRRQSGISVMQAPVWGLAV
jgi:hypothetical protein